MRSQVDSRNTNPSLLLSLVGDVKKEVIPQFLDTCAILNLAKTWRQFYSLFSGGPLYAHARFVLKELVSHAALGEWEDAEKVWKLFPDLLTCRGTVYHPNRIYEQGKPPVDISPYVNPGRYKYVNLTAWQIALMNEEYEEAEKMGQFMAEEEKQKQFAEIFPDGIIIKHNWDLEKAKRLLQAVYAEVIMDPVIDENDPSKMSEKTQKVLYALYDYVKPKPEHKTGLVFDANLYVEALKLYDDQFNKFQNYDRRTFWCIRVEEWLAACLGTGFLRPHSQGFGNDLKRTGCVLDDGSSYFAFRRRVNDIPGVHFLVGYYGGAPVVALGGGGACPRSFRNLCQAKTRSGTGFTQRYLRTEAPACRVVEIGKVCAIPYCYY